MRFSGIRTIACVALLCAAGLLTSEPIFAQAPPGPLPPSHPLPPPPAPPAKPVKKKPEVEPRKTLAGFWKLNADESDDPTKKFEEARQTRAGQGGGPGGTGGGAGGPRVGIGYPYPGGGPNGPYGGGGPRMGDPDAGASDEMRMLVRPAFSQDVSLKDAEVDSADEHSDRVVYYTDGRKLQKPKKDTDVSMQEVSAHWNGAQLVTDEKGPQGRKMSRTFELSSDGKQMYETWRIESKRSDNPVVIRYVYDAAAEYEK